MTTNNPTAPLSVYVVENDMDTRQLLTLLLESMGHTVATAQTMAQALEHLSDHRYDVLISDIGLPDGNGWQMMERLQAMPTANADFAVAMSGYGMGTDLEKSRVAGFRHHLIKPMDIEKLEDILLEAAQTIDGGKSR